MTTHEDRFYRYYILGKSSLIQSGKSAKLRHKLHGNSPIRQHEIPHYYKVRALIYEAQTEFTQRKFPTQYWVQGIISRPNYIDISLLRHPSLRKQGTIPSYVPP
jgi:hypothetical protein